MPVLGSCPCSRLSPNWSCLPREPTATDADYCGSDSRCRIAHTPLSATADDQEKTVLAVPASFVAMLTNVLANLWLLPRMGLLGAALATLISYAVLLVITGLQTRRLMPTIQSPTDVASISTIGILFVMVLHVLPAENEWQSLRNGLLGGILYLTGLFALNVAGWRENLWRWIKTRH